MAKYYLGTIKNGSYEPIKIDGIGTGIMDVANYTMKFADEIELREQLLREGKIEYYTDQLSYIKEDGPKGDKTYTVVPMGNRIATITSKEHFDKNFISRFMKVNMYNQEFYSSLLNFHIKKLNLDNGIKDRIKGLISSPSRIYHFTSLKKYLSEKSARLCDLLDKATTERNYQEMENLLEQLQNSIRTDKHDLINVFYYFRASFKNNYTGTVDRIDNAYKVIVRANKEGIESFELNPDEDKDLYRYIDEIFNHLIYTYDKGKKDYKRDSAGNKKVNERNLFELGMFVDTYIEYQMEIERQRIKSTSTPEEDYDHEEFLEEEDFAKLHTTSEREGYKLRRTDGTLFHL